MTTMKKLTTVVILLGLVLATKFILKNENSNPENVGRPIISMNEQKNSDCMPYEQYLYEHPDATDDELLQADQCSKARAVRLGLDKPNTGFLGNTFSPPKGALAHYKGLGGGNIFTVYDDYILASTSDEPGETEIPFSQVSEIK